MDLPGDTPFHASLRGRPTSLNLTADPEASCGLTLFSNSLPRTYISIYACDPRERLADLSLTVKTETPLWLVLAPLSYVSGPVLPVQELIQWPSRSSLRDPEGRTSAYAPIVDTNADPEKYPFPSASLLTKDLQSVQFSQETDKIHVHLRLW